MADRSHDPSHTVLDVRPAAAYNGWRLAGEPRGGHLPGARSLPLQWTRYMDWVEVVERKGLEPSRPTTVYGYTAEEGREMADKLERLGFTSVEVYDGFREWSDDPRRPLERLERYHQLVPPDWLRLVMDGGTPEAAPGADWVICHTHFGNREDYELGHIPGALSLDTNTLESPETWNRRSPEELKEALSGLGIRHDTTVIVYGRHSFPTADQPHPGQSAGHLGAMRCAAILLYAGVEDVRVLNGGIHSWEEAGYALTTEESERPEPATDFGADIPGHPEYMVDIPEAKWLIESDDGELVSVRSWPEFIGERSGYNYIEKTGRIPGAIFGNCGSDAYHMENYRSFDHTMREAGEVAQTWAEAGVVPDKHIAFYCGTGWRGSEAFMNAYLMGWPRVSVFDGGWFEWSSDPANPIETGVPEGWTAGGARSVGP